MSTKLYVGNLSYEMTEPQLQTLFSEAGEVTSAKIITDRQTGQPRGFGFVEMETKLEGEKAISMLNGRDLDGRPLTVNEAKPQQKGGLVAVAVTGINGAQAAAGGQPTLLAP